MQTACHPYRVQRSYLGENVFRAKMCSALTDQDLAGVNFLAAEALDAKVLRI